MDQKKFYLIAIITTILFCWTTFLIWKGTELAKSHSITFRQGSRMNEAILETDRTYAKQSLDNAIHYRHWLESGRTDLVKANLDAQIANNVISLASFSTYHPSQSQIDALKKIYPKEYDTIYNAFTSRHPDSNHTPFQKQIDVAFYSYLQQNVVDSPRTNNKVYEKLDAPQTR